jgi:hypothetical protein
MGSNPSMVDNLKLKEYYKIINASRTRDILQIYQGLCGLVVWKVSWLYDLLLRRK